MRSSLGLFLFLQITALLGCERPLEETPLEKSFTAPIVIDAENADFIYLKELKVTGKVGSSKSNSLKQIAMVVSKDGSVKQLIRKKQNKNNDDEASSQTDVSVPEIDYATIGPDGRTYVVFQRFALIEGKNCIFARARRSSETECVDYDAIAIETMSGQRPIQFFGNKVFYISSISQKERYLRSKPIDVRNISSELAKNLTTVNIGLEAFALIGDSLVMYGASKSTLGTTYFLRKVNLITDVLTTLKNLSSPLFYIASTEGGLHLFLSQMETEDSGFYSFNSSGDLVKDNSVSASVGSEIDDVLDIDHNDDVYVRIPAE